MSNELLVPFSFTIPEDLNFENFKTWVLKCGGRITSFLGDPNQPLMLHELYHDVYAHGFQRESSARIGGVYYFASMSSANLSTFLTDWMITLSPTLKVRKSGDGAQFFLLYSMEPCYIAPHTDKHKAVLLCLTGKRRVFLKHNGEFISVVLVPGTSVTIGRGQEHSVLAEKNSLALCIVIS